MTRMPPEFRSFFWDVRFDDLDLRRDRDFILRRLLAHGDWRAWRWLRRTFPPEELRTFLLRTRGRGIDDPARLTFYAVVLGISEDEVIRWIRERTDPWSRRYAVARTRAS